MCERACVTEKAAIHVLPLDVAKGAIGGHYIKGWEQGDEKRLEKTSSDVTTHTKRSQMSAQDYLNANEEMFK